MLSGTQPGFRKPGRSGQMVNCLRESFLYSEKRARDLLFDAIEQTLCLNRHEEPMILSRLTRRAAWAAQAVAQQTGYAFGNWDPASKAVLNAMLGAGVLLTPEGKAIRADVTAQATPVSGLKDGYRDLTEAYLVEFLIRKLGDVSTRDHKALAHALFRQFDPTISMEDLEDRVVLLLASLSDRIVLYQDGTYAVRGDTPSVFPLIAQQRVT
jgi:hypothetical protein